MASKIKKRKRDTIYHEKNTPRSYSLLLSSLTRPHDCESRNEDILLKKEEGKKAIKSFWELRAPRRANTKCTMAAQKVPCSCSVCLNGPIGTFNSFTNKVYPTASLQIDTEMARIMRTPNGATYWGNIRTWWRMIRSTVKVPSRRLLQHSHFDLQTVSTSQCCQHPPPSPITFVISQRRNVASAMLVDNVNLR